MRVGANHRGLARSQQVFQRIPLDAPAVALASEWLRRNLPKNPALLFQAGRAAELSGELKDAVAFYQQALKIADPKSNEAGEAITAVYALLINQLDNPGGAYAFGLNEAETLAVNPRFRQFDRWFLDTAIASRNGEAVARRLLATTKAGVPDDQLVALYSGDFRWLLSAVDGYVEQPQAVPFTQELYEAVKDVVAGVCGGGGPLASGAAGLSGGAHRPGSGSRTSGRSRWGC